jgi:UDP-3-O-[3-hydroxymyristoyl] glucosamine N-acyltransferase
MKQTLRDLAEKLGCHLLGDASITVTTVSSLQSATSESVVFVEDPQYLDAALHSPAAAVIVGDFAAGNFAASATKPHPDFPPAAPDLRPAPQNCYVDIRRCSASILPPSFPPPPNSATASPSEPAPFSANTPPSATKPSSAPGSIIGSETGPVVRIGMHCRIDANVTIYPGTTIGDRVVVQAGAVLGSEGFGYVRDSQTGHYEQFPQIGRLVIEDDVEIGANSTVDRGALDETRISRGTKIDNLVHIGHNVHIGQNVIIAAQTGLSGSATVEENVIIGGQVGIADHVRIEAGAILGAQSGIPTKKVIRGKGVVFWGTPARPIREYLKELAFLSRSAKSRSAKSQLAKQRRIDSKDRAKLDNPCAPLVQHR